MLETKCFGDNIHYLFTSVSGTERSPTTKICHQHPKIVNNFNLPTSLSPHRLRMWVTNWRCWWPNLDVPILISLFWISKVYLLEHYMQPSLSFQSFFVKIIKIIFMVWVDSQLFSISTFILVSYIMMSLFIGGFIGQLLGGALNDRLQRYKLSIIIS